MATKSIDIVLSAQDRASAKINRSAGIISRSLGGIGRVGRGAMGMLGAGVGLGFGFQLSQGLRNVATSSLRTGIDFERSMSRVEAVTEGAAGRMDDLRDAALEQGAATKFSATESADALFEFGKAGFTADQSMSALPGTLALASAGELGLAEAAEISQRALKTFQLGAGGLTRVADVMAKAANTTAADVTGLGQSFQHVGPIGAEMGMDLEQVVAPLAVLTDVLGDPEMAGTGLRKILTDLAGSESAARVMGEVGLSADKLREMDLPSQMEALSEATAGMTDKERIGFFTRMFDQRAGTAFVALLGQGSDRLRQVETELRNAGGTATRTATILQDNLAGSLEELGGAWETLKIRAFSSQDGMLKDTVDWLTGMVRFMGAEGFWGTLFDEIAMQLTGFATVQLPMWFMELSEIVAFHAVDIGTRMAFGIAEGLLGLERLMVDTVLGAVETTWGKLGDIVGTVAPDHVNFPKQIAEAAKSAANVADTVGGALGSKLEATKKTALAANKAIHDERMAEISAEYDADLQYIADSSTARWSALFAEADKSKQAKDDSIPLAANLGAGAANIEAATAGMNEAAQESKALLAIGDSSLPTLNESRFLTGLGSRHKEDLDEAKRHTVLLKAILSALGGLPASGGGPGLGIL